MNLFLDSSSSKVCILLFNKKKPIFKAVKIVDVNYLHVDQFVDILFDFFKSHNFNLQKLEEIYFTNGPGKYIGTKVALIIIKIICIFIKNIKLFVTNSLLFATGFFTLSKTASLAISKTNNMVIEKNNKNIIYLSNQVCTNHNYLHVTFLLQNFEKFTKYFQETEMVTISEYFCF